MFVILANLPAPNLMAPRAPDPVAVELVRAGKAGFRPDRLMPHARVNAVRTGNTILAPAAAVRSDGLWYEIAFRCRLNAADGTLAGLEYVLGPPIEKSLWDELGLAEVY